MSKGERILDSLLYRKLLGFLAFSFGFSFILMNAVDALVYLGQSYSGWGMFGYGFDDIVSLYYMYPGWIDFFIFFGIFVSLGKAVFGKKFEGGAGKGLAVSVGVALSLGLVLFENNTGVYLLAESAMVVFFLASIAVFYGIFTLFHKKMGLNKAISFFASLIATYFMWYLVSSFTGLSTLEFFSFGFGSMDLFWPITIIVITVVLFLTVPQIMNYFINGGRMKGIPDFSRKDPKDPKDPKNSRGNPRDINK